MHVNGRLSLNAGRPVACQQTKILPSFPNLSHPVGVALPLSYNVRNIFVRWRATLATVLGVALVVAVYVLVQSMAVGLEKSSSNTGDPRNVMIVRKGSTAESSSQVTREQFRLILYWDEIARDEAGQPLVSPDTLVLVNIPRKTGEGESHVLFRGIS